MLIDGIKYACDACIRGHRVSHCQHSERELHKVAPKGRPVSQCPHCRGARKARAQHVACNCAEKGHDEADCPHRKGEKNESHTCCCTHGARCGCSLKKDHRKDHHLDPVPEDAMSEMATPESFDIKPQSAISTPSEGKMTVFANGHHKPVHKHNDAAHTRGLPYTIPRPHSIHGHSEIAQRSVDSLPSTKRSLISHETPVHHDSVTSAPQPVRRVKSQPGSPGLRPIDARLSAIDTASLTYDATNSPYGAFSGSNSPITSSFSFNAPDPTSDSYFGYPSSNADIETPLHSAGLNPPPVDWSSLGIQPYSANEDYGVTTSQPPSYASYDYSHDYSHASHPGLASSSGELSEAEDYPTTSESATKGAITIPADDASYGAPDNNDSYRLSNSSSMMNYPHQSNAMNMLKQENMEEMDIDDIIRRANEQAQEMEAQKQRQHANSVTSNLNNSLPTPPRSVPTPPSAILQQAPLHGLTIREAQNYAHMQGNETNLGIDSGSSSINKSPSEQDYSPHLHNANGEDPMWSNPADMDSPEEAKWDS